MTTAAVDNASSGTTTVGASRAFAWMLVVTGAAGLLAAWVITLDKFKLLEDPNFTPGCSLNPIVSCGNIMKSEQASAFGFPNPMLGLVTYAMVVAIGVGLLAGARYRRWYWLGLNAGTLFGTGFCMWLMHQSLYEINALCLWCSLAWIATIIMFWYVTSHNVRNGLLPAPRAVRGFLDEFTWVLPAVHIGIIGMLVLTRWWDFWTG
ncbi:vitamin K epoxide reductase family protein [Streptomyces sp. WAC05374]|uniref:vitamin K epoxide reductase family protein n=1 Tax=Streptomyces sp. WAC05374 TaxID=2487420 RepID=UPI000F88683B|nr:vitamin K epoxide reductase family protein [Streptomyces sp. WAC05374]RST17503.1 vitamin K epoxide reductase family protein [Streptomyces sp. WAC05374]TDF43506.1 vitamin K epoxide reductase family protein [Streptomyces sp. WAC05374]TDF51593.1 vitamin K epoxide reductase family protein [Streptomyces sp. WAC05374]TDF53253.1 vitamin K epoxide reductase family protein [Streptomyces sp. WAC05374]